MPCIMEREQQLRFATLIKAAGKRNQVFNALPGSSGEAEAGAPSGDYPTEVVHQPAE